MIKQSIRFIKSAMCLLKSFSCQINFVSLDQKISPFDCFSPVSISLVFMQHCSDTYLDSTLTFVLLKQAETKVMNKRSIFDSKTLNSFSQRQQPQASHSLSSQFPVRESSDHFKFYNKDYDPFINIKMLNVQNHLKRWHFKGFYFQPRFHVGDF